MTDAPRHPDTGDTPPGVPRWVKISAIVVGVLVVLVVAVMIVSGGEHGPGRHTSSGDTPPTSVPSQHTPPPGGHG